MEKQVLLISGGDALSNEELVAKYNAGTDTNPIFLFSMLSVENPHHTDVYHSGTGPGMGRSDGSEEELEMRVEASMTLPDAPSTVSVRASIAQDYVKVCGGDKHNSLYWFC